MSKVSLSKNIMSIIDTQMNDFISQVSQKYNIDINELTSLWNGNEPLVVSSNTKPQVVIPVEAKTNTGCQHLWSKGERKGTICGCVVKNPTKKYCVKHINQNKTQTVTPSPTEGVKPTAKVIRRNKSIDKLWHEESGMVFESIDDRRIIGKYVDGEVVMLNESDVQTCKELGFVIKSKPHTDDVVANVVEKTELVASVVEQPNVNVNVNMDTIDEVEKLLSSMMVGGDDEFLEEEE